jgi:dTDP-glucose pyrophosphorylase
VTELVGAILAGGRGRRMGPLGSVCPKPLLPIANKPLIAHHLRVLESLGIERVFVVVGGAEAQIRRVAAQVSGSLELQFIEQGPSLGSAFATACLAPVVDGPFVLILGDYYFVAPELSTMVDGALRSGCSAMASKEELSPKALAEACAVYVSPDGRITRIVEKPWHPETSLKGCGVYVFQPDFFDALRQTPRTALRDEYELSVSIELHIEMGRPFLAQEIIVWDTNLTRPVDVLECNLQWLRQRQRRSLVGADVELAEGTTLDEAMIGDRSVLAGPTVLRQVVMFPDSRLEGGSTFERMIVANGDTFDCPAE